MKLFYTFFALSMINCAGSCVRKTESVSKAADKCFKEGIFSGGCDKRPAVMKEIATRALIDPKHNALLQIDLKSQQASQTSGSHSSQAGSSSGREMNYVNGKDVPYERRRCRGDAR